MKMLGYVTLSAMLAAAPGFANDQTKANVLAQSQGALHGFAGASVSLGLGYAATRNFDETVATTDTIFSFNQADATGSTLRPRLELSYSFDLGQNLNLSLSGFRDFGIAKTEVTQAAVYQDPVYRSLRDTAGITIAPGVYLDDSTLFYAKFGATTAVQSYSRPDYDIALDTAVSGTLFGIGVKKMVGAHRFVGIEFSHSDYGMNRVGSAVPLDIYEVNVTSHMVDDSIVASVGYQF